MYISYFESTLNANLQIASLPKHSKVLSPCNTTENNNAALYLRGQTFEMPFLSATLTSTGLLNHSKKKNTRQNNQNSISPKVLHIWEK